MEGKAPVAVYLQKVLTVSPSVGGGPSRSLPAMLSAFAPGGRHRFFVFCFFLKLQLILPMEGLHPLYSVNLLCYLVGALLFLHLSMCKLSGFSSPSRWTQVVSLRAQEPQGSVIWHSLARPLCSFHSQEARRVLSTLALPCLASLARQGEHPPRPLPHRIRNRHQGVDVAQTHWDQEGDFCHKAVWRLSLV